MRKLLIIPILIILLVIPFVYAIKITNDPSLSFTYDSTKGTAGVKVNIQATSNNEYGLIELQFPTNNYLQSAIFGAQSACDSSKPYNVHKAYQLTNVGDQGILQLDASGIPDGTYYPTLISYSSCCSQDSNCHPILDSAGLFNTAGYTSVSPPRTFKLATSTCAAIVYDLSKGCVASGSGCGDNINLFNSQDTCKSKLPPVVPNFKLSNLKRITWGNAVISSNLPLNNYFLFDRSGDVYTLTITNTGTATKGLQLESYYISKTNPFADVMAGRLSSSIPLQDVLGIKGITENLASCNAAEKLIVSSYTIDPLAPQESKDVFVIAKSVSQSDSSGLPTKLAGNDNYNSLGQYLLVITAYDTCGGTIYDSIGGTKGYTTGGLPAANTTTQDINNTAINANARQKTTTRDLVKTSTGTALLDSTCVKPEECYEGVSCVSMQSLVDDGTITKEQATSKLTRYRVAIDTVSTTTGVLAGFWAGAKISATAGLGLCQAVGVSTAELGGVGFPICLGVLGVTGGIVGGITGDYISDIFHAIGTQDLTTTGYCIKDLNTTGFTGFINSLGKLANKPFGNPTDDTTMGYIVFGVGVFIFIAIALRR